MRSWQVATGLALLVVGLAVLTLPTVGVGTDLADDGTVANAEGNGMGAQVSSFMQSSAADADSSVDRGMRQASVNQGAEPGQAVEQRTSTLEDRLERLQDRADRLDAMHENGTIPEPAYNARASALRAQIANLQSDIDHARQIAQRHGVDESKLDRLRSDARNMTGPEVAEVARNITDAPRGPPDGAPGGPSDGGEERGPPDDGADRGSDGSSPSDDGDERGPPDDSGPSEEGNTETEDDDDGTGDRGNRTENSDRNEGGDTDERQE